MGKTNITYNDSIHKYEFAITEFVNEDSFTTLIMAYTFAYGSPDIKIYSNGKKHICISSYDRNKLQKVYDEIG